MTKRAISVLVLILILAMMLPVVGASAMIGPQYVYTSNGKSLNIRSGPSKDYQVVGSIPYGVMADSFEYYDGVWAYVSYNGMYGYAMTRYFVSYQPGPKPQPQPTHTKSPSPAPSADIFSGFVKTSYYVTVRPSTPSGFVNMRWAPSKSDGIESTYYAGYQLRVIAQNNTWAQVYDESTDTCGFIMRGFLTDTGVGAAN